MKPGLDVEPESAKKPSVKAGAVEFGGQALVGQGRSDGARLGALIGAGIGDSVNALVGVTGIPNDVAAQRALRSGFMTVGSALGAELGAALGGTAEGAITGFSQWNPSVDVPTNISQVLWKAQSGASAATAGGDVRIRGSVIETIDGTFPVLGASAGKLAGATVGASVGASAATLLSTIGAASVVGLPVTTAVSYEVTRASIRFFTSVGGDLGTALGAGAAGAAISVLDGSAATGGIPSVVDSIQEHAAKGSPLAAALLSGSASRIGSGVGAMVGTATTTTVAGTMTDVGMSGSLVDHTSQTIGALVGNAVGGAVETVLKPYAQP
ncbi:hypothetical protein HNP40_000582 [Mycobacteroides chelonae]|nr:hypothetical protein [Mycobacteroides chelonae]